MFVFRSLVLGLLGACCLLLAERPHRTEAVTVVQVPAPPSATIVDVSSQLDAAQIASLIHVDRDEAIFSIDDRPVASDLEAGARLAQMHRPGFADVNVQSATGMRRVIVLAH